MLQMNNVISRVTYNLLEVGLLRECSQLKVKHSGVRLLGTRLVKQGQSQHFWFVVWP